MSEVPETVLLFYAWATRFGVLNLVNGKFADIACRSNFGGWLGRAVALAFDGICSESSEKY